MSRGGGGGGGGGEERRVLVLAAKNEAMRVRCLGNLVAPHAGHHITSDNSVLIDIKIFNTF